MDNSNSRHRISATQIFSATFNLLHSYITPINSQLQIKIWAFSKQNIFKIFIVDEKQDFILEMSSCHQETFKFS